MSTEFRTNRKTRQAFPLGTERAKSIGEILAGKPTAARRELQRFLAVKALQDRSQWHEVAGYPNWNTYETSLILDNDQRSSRWLRAWGESWARKMKFGRYNKEAAEFAVWKYIVPAAQGKGRAREWKAGRTYDEHMRPYYEDEFVGDANIDRDNVDYGFIVDRINDEWQEHIRYETEKESGYEVQKDPAPPGYKEYGEGYEVR